MATLYSKRRWLGNNMMYFLLQRFHLNGGSVECHTFQIASMLCHGPAQGQHSTKIQSGEGRPSMLHGSSEACMKVIASRRCGLKWPQNHRDRCAVNTRGCMPCRLLLQPCMLQDCVDEVNLSGCAEEVAGLCSLKPWF